MLIYMLLLWEYEAIQLIHSKQIKEYIYLQQPKVLGPAWFSRGECKGKGNAKE